MKILAVIGAGQNTGKTTMVVNLVEELTGRGLAVGTIKQVHERNFSFDKKGKDSWRHAEAGARIVIAASPVELAAIKRINGRDRLEEALKLIGEQELDILIIEGHPGIDVPMVYAARSFESISPDKPVDPNVVCLVSLTPEELGDQRLPVFHIVDDRASIADLLLK